MQKLTSEGIGNIVQSTRQVAVAANAMMRTRCDADGMTVMTARMVSDYKVPSSSMEVTQYTPSPATWESP